MRIAAAALGPLQIVATVRAIAIGVCYTAIVTFACPHVAFAADRLVLPSERVAATPLEDPPQPFAPLHPRSEADADRVEARAMLLAGRTSEQRGETAAALRAFQRAWRLEPSAPALVVDIVVAADHLRRPDIAGRYLMFTRESDEIDPAILQRTVLYLIDRGDAAAVAHGYRLAIAQAIGDSPEQTLPLWIALGRVETSRGELKRAAAAFTKVWPWILRPDNIAMTREEADSVIGEPTRTYRMMAEAFLAAGQIQLAGEAIERAFAKKRNMPARSYLLAQWEAARGDSTAALKQLNVYFDTAGGEGDAPFALLAKLLAAMNRSAEYPTRVAAIFARHPNDIAARRAHARALRDATQFAVAAAHFEAVYSADTSEAALTELAELYQKQANAAAWLAVVGKHFDMHGLADVRPLATLIATAVADQKFATTLFDRGSAVQQARESDVPTGELAAAALVAIAAKDARRGNEWFDIAIVRPPGGEQHRTDSYFAWAGAFAVAGDYASEAAVHRRASADPAIASYREVFLGSLGMAQIAAGDVEQGLVSMRRAEKLRSSSAKYAARFAGALYQAGQLAEAQQELEQVLKIWDRPSADEATRRTLRDARFLLASIASDRGDRAAASEQLEEILDEYPANVEAENDLGYQWAEQNVHLRRAHAMIGRAVAAEPENSSYRDSLGWVLFRLGEFDRAIIELELAALPAKQSNGQSALPGASEPSPVVLDHLGDAYFAAGRRDAAIAAWQRAAKLLAGQIGAKRKQAWSADAVHQVSAFQDSLASKIKQHTSRPENVPTTQQSKPDSSIRQRSK